MTERLVLAAGPLLADAAGLLGLTLPVFAERHHKIAIEDTLGAVPRDAPFLIWDDAQTLEWSPRSGRRSKPTRRAPLDARALPGRRPHAPGGYGLNSQTLLVLWSYDCAPTPVVYPLPEPPHYPELVLRGMARMIPAFHGYRGAAAGVRRRGLLREDRREPSMIALPVEGAYVSSAYAGFGIMAGCAGGDWSPPVTGEPLPDYAAAFALARYGDPAHVRRIEAWGATTGQI